MAAGREGDHCTLGTVMRTSTLLRTTKPGRMQVLGNGRQFRMGGDAQLRLGSSDVELLKDPSLAGSCQVQRVVILHHQGPPGHHFNWGTTVFLEFTDQRTKCSAGGRCWWRPAMADASRCRVAGSCWTSSVNWLRSVDAWTVLRLLWGEGSIVMPPTPGRDGSRSPRSRDQEPQDVTWEPLADLDRDAERRLQKVF